VLYSSLGFGPLAFRSGLIQSYKNGVVMDARHEPLRALSSYREAVHLRPDIEAYKRP